jgi:predicted DNA-binding protein with PD1-like motif
MKQSLFLVLGVLLCFAPIGVRAAAGDEAPAVFTASSPVERVIIVRLKNKTDMLDGLQQAVTREHIRNAVILSGFGSVTSYQTHVVGNTTLPAKNVFTKENGPYDLTTVGGFIMNGRVHAHITLASTQKMTGGHLEPGTTVFTFVTVSLAVVKDSLDLNRLDDSTWH